MSDPRFKFVPISDTLSSEQCTRLVRIMEECAELTQAAAKVLRFGLDGDEHNPYPTTPLQRLNAEMADVREAMSDWHLLCALSLHAKETER